MMMTTACQKFAAALCGVFVSSCCLISLKAIYKSKSPPKVVKKGIMSNLAAKKVKSSRNKIAPKAPKVAADLRM